MPVEIYRGYRVPLTQPSQGEELLALMSSHLSATEVATTIQRAVEEVKEVTLHAFEAQTSTIVHGVGEKLEAFMDRTIEQLGNMHDMQPRDHWLSVGQAWQGQANTTNQQIHTSKSPERRMKKYTKGRKRMEQSEGK